MITVHPRPDTLDRSTVEAYRSVAPATLGHALETAMEPAIRALWRPVKLVGPALTVETARDLYAAVNEAAAIAQPGDVLVVATGRDPRHAITGEFTLRNAQEYGIAGMVVDALMADARALESMRFPVFCWGSSPALMSAMPRQSREPQATLNVPSRSAASASTPATWSWPTTTASSSPPRTRRGRTLRRARRWSRARTTPAANSPPAAPSPTSAARWTPRARLSPSSAAHSNAEGRGVT